MEVERLDARTKIRWDPEEVHLMVAFERAHPGESLINQLIH